MTEQTSNNDEYRPYVQLITGRKTLHRLESREWSEGLGNFLFDYFFPATGELLGIEKELGRKFHPADRMLAFASDLFIDLGFITFGLSIVADRALIINPGVRLMTQHLLAKRLSHNKSSGLSKG